MVKASIYFGDIDEGDSVSYTECYTVQDLGYQYNHTQSSSGVAVGSATQKAELSFSIKSQSQDTAIKLYKMLSEGYVVSFSLMFDASETNVETGNKYISFDDAMVVSGYVTSVEEHFAAGSYIGTLPMNLRSYFSSISTTSVVNNNPVTTITYDDAMLITVKLIIHSVSYLAREKTGDISSDDSSSDSSDSSNVLLQLK